MSTASTNLKTTLPISEARRRIFEITDAVQKSGLAYTVTEQGRPKAVIISAEEFESLLETLEILHEYPTIQKDVERARKEYAEGKYMTLESYVSGSAHGKRQKKSRSASRKR